MLATSFLLAAVASFLSWEREDDDMEKVNAGVAKVEVSDYTLTPVRGSKNSGSSYFELQIG